MNSNWLNVIASFPLINAKLSTEPYKHELYHTVSRVIKVCLLQAGAGDACARGFQEAGLATEKVSA